MKFKNIIWVLMLMLLVVNAAASTNEAKEFQIHTILSTMGMGESTVVVTDDEVIVDYVMKDIVSSDYDIMAQLQLAFMAEAKFAPDTTFSVVKGRYSIDTDPIIYAAVPTDMTRMFMDDFLSAVEFWSLVTVNEPELVDEVQDMEKGNSPWTWLLWLLIIAGVGFLVYKLIMKKSSSTSTTSTSSSSSSSSKVSEKSSSSSPTSSQSSPLFGWTKVDATKHMKIIALILNLLLPGLGYFVLGKPLLKKAALFTVVSIVLHIIPSSIGLLVFLVGLYTLIDMILAIKNS